jgi:hypothetical protein
MEPREIPFNRCVLPIVNEPTVMRWRLDFADWLAKNGHKERADWFRRACTCCEKRTPLVESYATSGLDRNAPPRDELEALRSELGILRSKWEACRPAYWPELDCVLNQEGILQKVFFGRVSVHVWCYPPNLYPVLGATPLLVTAFRDGWLESLACGLLDADQVRTVLGWPESHRALPLHIDVTRCLATGFDDRLMAGLLELEGLHGLTLCADEVGYPCMKRFGATARNLRYLQLLSLRRTGPSYRMLEQLGQLPELRFLVVGVNVPADEHVRLFAAIPKLQCLHLCGQDITDKGLLALQGCGSLRSVLIRSGRVTRAGIYALREARPDLRVVAIDETLEWLGPV